MKSKQSITIEALLRKSLPMRTHTDMQQELAKKRKQNAKPYKLPNVVQLVMRPEKVSVSNTTCYKLGKGNTCVLYFHGGSYVDPPNIFHWRFLQHLTREMPVSVVLPMYGRAPQHSCRQTVLQQKHVYMRLVDRFGADNIVFMGDSAGGGLALALCEYLAEKNLPQPQKLLLFSPWLDVSMQEDYSEQIATDLALNLDELRFWGEQYIGTSEQNRYLHSPMYGISAKLPPMHVFVGGAELFLPDCRKFKQLAEQAGASICLYEYPEMQHAFVMYPIPEAKEARKKVEEILSEV